MGLSAATEREQVFVLDDDEGILELQRRALERAGYDVVVAATPTDAEAALAQSDPQLLVLDYNLGGGATGLDFYRRLRQRRDDVPAILVTGFSDEGRAIEALRAGVRDVIPKVGDYLEYLPDAVGRILAQDRAARALAEAEAAGRAKDRFLAILSHELRTPLTPVLTAVQMLCACELSPEPRELVDVIRRNVELEARLIDDLLDLTRVAKGKLQLHPAAVALHDALNNALQMINDQVAAKHLNLIVQTNAAASVVEGDPTRLQQVFWNLLKNAAKFTRDGGSITVRTSNPAPGRVRVEIIDTGIGIEPQFLDDIFNAFEQGGKQVMREFGGLGLGLNISRALVVAHGGQIRASSEGLGRGATFAVELPLRRATSERHPAPTAPATPTSGEAATRPHVLLVEDHADTAAMMARLLRRVGYSVTTADTVAAALTAASSERCQVVISDIALPDGSGLDLMRQLRQRHDMHGIALSGFGMEEDAARSRDAGFSEHLVKPVSFDVLQKALLRLTNGNQDD